MLIGVTDVPLEFQHDRAGAVHHLETQIRGKPVSLRGFSVCPDQKRSASGGRQVRQVLLRDRDESPLGQTFQLFLIMHDRPEGMQGPAGMLRQETLRTADGTDHSPAKTGMRVYFDGKRHQSRMPKRPWIRPSVQTTSSLRVMSELSRTKASSARASGETSRWESI